MPVTIKIPDITKRSDYRDWLGMIDPTTGVVTWELMDDLFTEINFSFNPTTMSLWFTNQPSQTTITTGYAPSIALNGVQDRNNPIAKEMLMTAYKMKTGAALAFMYRRVFEMYPVEGQADNYEALEFLAMLGINDNNPDNGVNKFTGTLSYFSSFAFGAFDATTKTFTPEIGGTMAQGSSTMIESAMSTDDGLDAMTVTELKTYASNNGVYLSSGMTKEDIIVAIRASLRG